MPLPQSSLARRAALLGAATFGLALAGCNENSAPPGLLEQAFAPEDPGRFAYVINSQDDTVSGYVVGTFGRLQADGYFAYSVTPTAPGTIVAHPNREYFFTTNDASSSVSVLSVDALTGELIAVGGLAGLGFGPLDLVVHPSGQFVYVVAETSNQLSTLAFDPETAELSFLGSVLQTPTATPRFVRIDPRSRYLIVLDANGGALHSYPIASNGGLAAGSTLSIAPGLIGGGAIDVGGNNVYVSSSNFDVVIRVEVVTDNTVYPLLLKESRPTDSDLDAVAGPTGVDLHPSGRFAYVLNQDADNIFFYSIDKATFELVPIGALPSLEGATQLVFEPEGNTAYLIDPPNNRVLRYAWNFEDGVLEPREEIRTRKGPAGMAFLQAAQRARPVATRLYVANRASSDISSWSIDPDTGLLTSLGAPVPAGVGPIDLAVDRRGMRLFVVHEASRDLRAWSIDADGGLDPLGASAPLAGAPTALAIDPSARFVYVAQQNPDSVVGFRFDDQGALLALGPPLGVGEDPAAIGVDPTGQWLYVANSAAGSPGTSSTVSIFSISPQSGALTPVTPSATLAGGAASLSFSPFGVRLYTGLAEADAALPAGISATLGTLAAVPPATPTAVGPADLTTVPSDRYVYVAARDEPPSGLVQLFDVRASDGVLVNDEDGSQTARQALAAGVAPTALRVDPQEDHLYVVGRDSGTVSVLSLAADGTLAPLAEVDAGTEPVAAALVTRVD